MKRILFYILIMLCFASICSAKTIDTALYRIGGTALQAGDVATLAKYDIVVMQKFHYNDIDDDANGSTTVWDEIHAINANTEIYTYISAYIPDSSQEAYATIDLNNPARFYDERGHTQGDLENDNPTFFMLDTEDARCMYGGTSETRYFIDFGNASTRQWMSEVIINDHICSDWSSSSKAACATPQPWVADGIWLDNMLATQGYLIGSQLPEDYQTDSLWGTAMNGCIDSFADDIAARGKKVLANRVVGQETTYSEWRTQWLALDNLVSENVGVLQEGAFGHNYGSYVISWRTPDRWKIEVDTFADMSVTRPISMIMTDLEPGESGNDNYGKSTTFWDVLWYGIGSYLLEKNPDGAGSYFSIKWNASFSMVDWFDEYDYLDLGDPVGNYYTKVVDGTTFYLRKFDSGYVVINPGLDDETTIDYSDLGITETCREITHDNMDEADWDTISTSTQFATFKSHRAKILWVNAVGTHTPLPSGEQSCAEPMVVSLQASTVMNANCKYDTNNVSYAEMANTYTTGQGGKLHTKSLTLSCDTAYTYYTRCIGLSVQSDADSSSITHSFTTGAGSPPDPKGGGQINVEVAPGSIGIMLGGTVKTVDISP